MTLLSEDDWDYVQKYNPAAKLRKNCTRFVPYGTNRALPVLGKARVMLQCEEGMRIYTTVYVVAGQTENLLGERDVVALGILSIKPGEGWEHHDCQECLKMQLSQTKPGLSGKLNNI